MKSTIKSFLKHRKAYEYLKYSQVFRLYEFIFKHHVIKQHQKEVALYKNLLHHSCNLIFDIGAYDGHKTAAFLNLCKKVISCEPDPYNFRVLQIRFRRQKQKIFLHNVALSNAVGEEVFLVHHDGSAFNTLNKEWKNILEKDNRHRWDEHIEFAPNKNIEVKATTLDELIKQYGIPDFIKIDVEGYEKEVFQGLSQKIPCISFECLLPEFKPQLLYILEKLISFDEKTVFNVIFNEELIFPRFLAYLEIVEWLEKTDLYCFDMVAKTPETK